MFEVFSVRFHSKEYYFGSFKNNFPKKSPCCIGIVEGYTLPDKIDIPQLLHLFIFIHYTFIRIPSQY